jgi:hypothetical protein
MGTRSPWPGKAPPICASTDPAATVPSIRIRQCVKGSTSSNDSEPAPSVRTCPSGPSGSWTGPGSTALKTRPSAQATLIWMSWVSHWSATASTPQRGRPMASRSSQIHAFTDSRSSGLSGCSRHTRSSCSS